MGSPWNTIKSKAPKPQQQTGASSGGSHGTYYKPGPVSNPYPNDPYWPAAYDAANAKGLLPGGQIISYTNDFHNVASGAAGAGAGGYGGAGGGGGGSRSGGGGSSSASAKDAISQLWAHYNRPQDNTLMDAIKNLTGQAQTQGNSAVANLVAGLQGQQNPYTGVGVPMPQVATNPMAQYMQASGADSSATDALQQALATSAQQTGQADQSLLARMQQAWQAQQQSRIADAQNNGSLFNQNLATNSMGLQYQEAQRQQKAKEDLMMQLLNMAVSNHVNLGSLGVKF